MFTSLLLKVLLLCFLVEMVVAILCPYVHLRYSGFEVQSAYRQQRFMQEVTIQYNLCNEPWYSCILLVMNSICSFMLMG